MKLKIGATLLTLLLTGTVQGQMIMFVNFNSDSTDSFSFVALADIASGTEINFTDKGWQNSGNLRSYEGVTTWTASTNITAGEVIDIEPANLSLATNGDQILAFLGSESSPTFLSAINFDVNGFDDAVDANTTGLPAGLSEGYTAIDLGKSQNGYYSGTLVGTANQLAHSIANPDNWTLSSDNIGTWNSRGELTFTVSAIPEPSTYAAILCGLALGAYSIRRRNRLKATT